MASNILDEVKELLPKFYYEGEWNNRVELLYNGRAVDDNVIEFLGELFHFLIDSSILNDETKIYITSSAKSVAKAIELYNNQCNELNRIDNLGTAQNKIQYCKRTMNKYFEPDTLNRLMAYPEKHLDNCYRILSKLEREYLDDKEYNNAMVLKFSKEYINYSIDTLSWNKLLNIINVYSKKYISKISSGESNELDVDMIGYYNYLISSHKLSKLDQDRLKEIRKILDLPIGDK